MSLQGSLDTFALPDVLVLLASTKKTGELHVAGHRDPAGARAPELQGLLWVADGLLVGYDVATAVDAPTALFELLRLTEGSFSFATGSPANPHAPVEIEPVLGEAQGYLLEWRDIERVVPSLAAWLRLSPDAPAAHISMRAEQWRLVVAIGSGCDVSSLVERLGQGELGGCRAVKELAEAGLVEVAADALGDRAAVAVPDSRRGILADVVAGGSPTAEEIRPVAEFRSAEESRPAEEPAVPAAVLRQLSSDRSGELDETEAPAARAGDDHARREYVALPSRLAQPSDNEPPAEFEDLDAYAEPRRPRKGVLLAGTQNDEPGSDEVPEASALGRQLASLPGDGGEGAPTRSPQDGEEGDEVDGDEPLNRGLLLKFLSSVRN